MMNLFFLKTKAWNDMIYAQWKYKFYVINKCKNKKTKKGRIILSSFMTGYYNKYYLIWFFLVWPISLGCHLEGLMVLIWLTKLKMRENKRILNCSKNNFFKRLNTRIHVVWQIWFMNGFVHNILHYGDQKRAVSLAQIVWIETFLYKNDFSWRPLS